MSEPYRAVRLPVMKNSVSFSIAVKARHMMKATWQGID